MNYTIVIFGANGDLATRKICPALAELKNKYKLKIISIDRSFDDNYQTNCYEIDHKLIGDLTTNTVYENLKKLILPEESVLYYCAVPYSLYMVITKKLFFYQLLEQEKKFLDE
jgi:glucose-6-phosphate 1-dehydrogenase